jgi:hypothetical protein
MSFNWLINLRSTAEHQIRNPNYPGVEHATNHGTDSGTKRNEFSFLFE